MFKFTKKFNLSIPSTLINRLSSIFNSFKYSESSIKFGAKANLRKIIDIIKLYCKKEYWSKSLKKIILIFIILGIIKFTNFCRYLKLLNLVEDNLVL